MPRGLKSKLRAREKRRQAQEESTDPVGAQEEEESPSSLSSGFRDVPQDSSAKVTPRNPRVPGGVCSTTTTDAVVSNARFNKDASNQEEERENSSQAQDNTEQWYRGAIDEKVVMLVHYLLYKYQMKEPITKADMMRNVIQVYRSHFHEILRKASDHLELIFGLDVKEMDPNRNTYVLINKLELNCEERDNRGMPMTGLLMTILGVIFTKGNCATEEEVWEVLNMMELFSGKKSLIYGDPKKLITEDFVQQQYLEYRQVPGSDPPCFEFLWGPRAHVETSKTRVLEFLAKIYNTVPSAFPSWYKEALQDQEESARARAAAKSCTIAMARARSKALASRFSHIE